MKKEIEVEVSARHIHLSRDDFALLFGETEKYDEVSELSQTGEFATDKKVEIIGKNGSLSARFLSPFRQETQVEISMTDAFFLGMNPPYSIDVEDGAEKVVIKGPIGEITREALIVARRHLHCNPLEGKTMGLIAGQKVSVEIKTKRGGIIFNDIEVKIAPHYNLRLHLDTDEGNAAGINHKITGELII